MDPNSCLENVRRFAARIMADFNSEDSRESLDAIELASCFQELDGWLGQGGFPPEAWRHER